MPIITQKSSIILEPLSYKKKRTVRGIRIFKKWMKFSNAGNCLYRKSKIIHKLKIERNFQFYILEMPEDRV
jgi:hypothetical protein